MYLSAVEKRFYIRLTVGDLAHKICRDHVAVKNALCARCRVNIKSHLLELISDRQNLLLVAVTNGNENSALALEVKACRSKSLEECVLKIASDTETLAR